MEQRIAEAHEVITEAIAQYQPVKVIGLFSGGHDSLTAVHVASQHPRFDYAVHLNTGIGLPETREFVRSTAGRWGWNLREYHAAPGYYEQFVATHGFPGPAQHGRMYQRLKERALRIAIRAAKLDQPRNATVLLISGGRSSESQRRMGHVKPIQKDGSKLWVNVIHGWDKADCMNYIDGNGIERSPVAQKIHKSGECLCGAFAVKGEMAELEFWYPEYAAYIKSLPSANDKPWGWGAYPQFRRGPRAVKAPGPMCGQCALDFGDAA